MPDTIRLKIAEEGTYVRHEPVYVNGSNTERYFPKRQLLHAYGPEFKQP